MGEAIDAGLELVPLLFWVALVCLITSALYIAKGIDSVLSAISIFGINPFQSIANAIESAIVAPLQDAKADTEKKVATAFGALLTALELFLGLTLLLVVGVKDALTYLWNHALAAFVHLITDPIRTLLNETVARLTALVGTVAANLIKAEHYADAAVSAAVTDLEHKITAAITTAEHAAEAYADTAVADLRKAENAALSAAVSTLNAGIKAAESAALAEVAAAEREAASALAAADATIDSAIAGVKAIAVTAEDDITTIVGKFGIPGTAALIAAIPLLGTLVNTIATESGLDNSACRSKVKGICGTDPLAWANFLAGLAAVGFLFSLEEMAQVANGLIGDLEPIVKQAA